MPVEFEDIAGVLAAHGLSVPNLNVLVPDADPYEVLAIQPAGKMSFEVDFIGNQNHELALKKFSDFLRLAKESNADLVLSPEYSCPWAALEAALLAGNVPAPGKLWALGCESITPADLTSLISRVPGLVWICETIQNGQGNFLDPVCYLLSTQTTQGVNRIAVIIQFKTLAMGGGEIFERDHMIRGTKRYFLRNGDHDHLRFYTLICSEALEFEINQARGGEFSQHPAIIFHPQLINDARHPGIRKYRADLFRHTCSDHVEVICLNWSREMRGANAPATAPLSIKGHSAVFLKSKRFDRSENAIKKNHSLGLYYSVWKEHETDLCILNFEEHVFLFSHQKVFLVGPAVQSRRTGPAIRELRTWDPQAESWNLTARADDGFSSLCASYQSPKLQPCLDELGAPVERERLLSLSAGTLEHSSDWYKVEKLKSFISEADERTKRLTFVHDCATASIEFRNEHLTRFIRLQTAFLERPNLYPPTIADLRDKLRIVFPRMDTNFRYNVTHSEIEKLGATVIFLGSQARAVAREFFDSLCRAWGGKDDRFCEELTRRIVVAFEDVATGTIQAHHSAAPRVTDASEAPSSILGDEQS